jgi:hypothetical protein
VWTCAGQCASACLRCAAFRRQRPFRLPSASERSRHAEISAAARARCLARREALPARRPCPVVMPTMPLGDLHTEDREPSSARLS